MKRSVAILLSALLLLTSVPMVSADAYNDDQFDWGDDACPHTQTETVEAVASTCTTQGHGVYTYCVACKLVLEGSRELLPLGDHAYEVETTPADCTNDGLSVYTCSVCFDSYEEVIPANDEHVYLYACDQYCNSCGEKTNPRAKHTVLHVEAKEAVSCIEFGNKEYWRCDSCNTVWLDADLRRQSNMKSVQTAGPCVSDSPACKDGVCVNCGLPCAAEAEHTYDNVCDADCNTCGDIREVEGHEYVPLSAEPATCDKDGFEKYYCPNCGDNYTVTVPAIGHDYDAVVTTPDCEKGGYTTYTCANCGDTYVADETDALGHVYDSDSDPDCNVCGAVRVVALPGDVDGNGKTNNRDLGILQKHLNGTDVTLDEVAADMDGNGKINNRDLGLLQKLLNA